MKLFSSLAQLVESIHQFNLAYLAKQKLQERKINEMNQKEKRIKIAKFCKIPSRFDAYGNPCWLHAPDYFNDLNAMHEAETYLTEKQKIIYAWELDSKLRKVFDTTCVLVGTFATASQRAEAFIKTISNDKTSP
jgi:hypothetical protein